ncbi:MAG TPA: hypothetical protein PKY87_03670 [Terricaulis sp.]|nr:hypothetical protein [Terricaulis sp.]
MRFAVLIAVAGALAACAAPGPRPVVTSATLAAADASTSLLVGAQLTRDVSTLAAGDGMDPAVTLTLRHADGRTLSFREANHTPHDVMAQAPGGPLAQIMGLFGEESPTLYHALPDQTAPFICGPEGPAALGVLSGEGGAVQIVGLKQTIQFETRPDGREEALPFSPDQVCARLRFTAG